ncbi:MAG: DUF4235 domain-containing protein [Promicromonosporaceae bacterium]|nr:DUF4235 domain-containing protein [Promicromonosporaceae bacterium]
MSMHDEPSSPEPLEFKLGAWAATVVAGWLAARVVSAVWQKATGANPPTDLDDESVSVAQAVTFAAVSGGVAVLARRLATLGARRAAGCLRQRKGR